MAHPVRGGGAGLSGPAGRGRSPTRLHGLSYFIHHRHGARFIGHTGSQAGFRSFFYIHPETGTAVLAAFNARNEARPEASAAGFRAVRDQALGLIAR